MRDSFLASARILLFTVLKRMMGYVVLSGGVKVPDWICRRGGSATLQLKGRRHEMDLICRGFCSGWHLLSVKYADV